MTFAEKVRELFAMTEISGPPIDERRLVAIAAVLGYELRFDQDIDPEGLILSETREILVRKGLSPQRRLFTAAHELAHLIHRHDLSYARARSGEEPPTIRREADEGASILLMYGPHLRQVVDKLNTTDPVELAPLFDVSEEAMRIRVKTVHDKLVPGDPADAPLIRIAVFRSICPVCGEMIEPDMTIAAERHKPKVWFHLRARCVQIMPRRRR